MDDRLGIFLTNTRRWKEFIWVRTAENMFPAIAQPPDIYQDATQEKFFPRVGITKWTVPVDDRNCKILGWRHFNPGLDEHGKGDRSKVGLNIIDFLGQTGSERSYAEGQRMPSDYEAQVGQGEITIHAEETLGSTDAGVAMLRRGLRRAWRGGRGPGAAAPEAQCRRSRADLLRRRDRARAHVEQRRHRGPARSRPPRRQDRRRDVADARSRPPRRKSAPRPRGARRAAS